MIKWWEWKVNIIYINFFKLLLDDDTPPVVVAALKSDLFDQRVITREQGLDFAIKVVSYIILFY